MPEADISAVHLAEYNVQVIMDYGVEGKSTEEEFEKNTQIFLDTIRFAEERDYIPFVSLKLTGFARFGILEKWHRGDTMNAPEREEILRVKNRIHRICEAGVQNNTMILIDAEESWIQIPVDEMADEMMEKFNRGRVVVFNTFQMYRHDRLEFIKTSHQKAKEKGYILGAKLVRGAYMEKERQRASDMGYTSPIQPDKKSCDHDYDEGVKYCLENIKEMELFIGTHNEESCLRAVEIMKHQGIDKQKVHFSQLYGMSDNISFNLAESGYQVSKYLPYGPVKDVIPYLMRRANENKSVAGQTGRELSLIKKEILRRKKESRT